MANDCLVTKLKGSVDNESLEYLGFFKVEVKSVESPTNITQVLGFGTVGVKVKTADGSAMLSLNSDFSNPQSEVVTTPGNTSVYFLNGNYTALVAKYTFKGFDTCPNGINEDVYVSYSLCLDDIAYANYGAGVMTLVCSGMKSTKPSYFENIIKSPLSRCYLFGGDVRGDLSAFVNVNSANNITEMVLRSLRYATGNISVMGRFKTIKDLNFGDSPLFEGTLESVCSGMVTAGRASGTMRFISNAKITYNGSIIGNWNAKGIKFGTDMIDPTPTDTERGYQVSEYVWP